MNVDDRGDGRIDPKVDAALRAAFAPPPRDAFAAQAREAVATAPRGSGHRLWPWLLAAAAAVFATVLWLELPRRAERTTGEPDGRAIGAMWVAAYEHALEDGFAGGGCCMPDVDLAKACEERFASRLGLAAAGSVQLIGCYCGDRPTGGCMALLARSNGDPVAVYVLPCSDDPRPELPAGSGLHLARREVGPLVLYSMSKSPMPDALAQFVVP